MDEEELRQIQDDEKVAIQAIFDEDAEFEVNVWKVWKPLAVTIHLEPVESASFSTTRKNFVSLDLIVQCCSSYPKVAPTLSCGAVKGISNEDVRILFQKLSTKCEELIGSAMILELCEMVRLFLYEKNTPLAGSFHDTMLKKKASEESEMRRQRAHSEKRELEQVVEERDRHIIEAQWKKETEKENLNHAVAKNTDIRMIAGHRITVIDDVTLKRPRIHSLCTEWMGSCNNDDILVSEWTFQYTLGRHHHHKKTPNFDSFLKKCDEMEAQLTRVTSLVELDQTVVPICFATLQREHISPTNMLIKVMIGQKVSQREESLASATAIDTLKQDASLIRRLAAHMVCALRWLHDQQFSHGSVTSSAIWMTDNSFRISDTGLLPLLRSLADCFQQSISGREMDILTEPMERSPRRKDLFALGTLLDQLKTSISPSNSSSTLSSSCELTEFILCCQSAKTTDDLLNHSYLVLDLLPSGSDVGRLGVRTEADSRGRLVNEFLVMKWLGKGGFGDVILAKNKLDGNDYAVKRIPLNPKSEKLNRRITREAKLFSKLNHPNVVRYYSAWIEDASRQKERPSVEKGDAKKDKISPKRISIDDGADSLLPTRLRNLELAVTRGERGDTSEWSTSYRKGVKHDTVDSSSDDDSGDLVRTLFSPRNNASEDDFEILFEASGSAAPESDPVTETEATGEKSAATTSAGGTTAPTATTAVTENTNECSIPSRLLYIQMEYCERSTLRVLIDSRSLVGNAKTIWRIFGEILAGLLYIHRLGMIHRDIKPMNILLDSQDRVKIGDFGLATRDLLLKKDYLSTSHDGKMSGQTRDIGTELYMAPELFVLDDTHPYTSKIDVYSTGIILFEMFYRPLPPGMERISTIKNLKKAINMPDDFGIEFSAVQTSLARRLIEWMLSEKADERPTVEQLLAEDRIPIADIDDENFQGIFLRTIKKRSGRLFHWMIDAVFKEEASAALNYCFDQQICMDKFNASRDHELEAIRGEISAVCRLHSFEPLDTHLLTPAKQPTGSRNKPVTLMDTAGYIGALPVDLRQNFVRYCCRNAVYRLKRYTFSKVFSNNDSVGGVHPCERHECSVDSIGPVSAALTLTADLLTTVGQLANTTLDGLKCTLRIGHVHVIESAMRHLAIPVVTRMLVLQALHQISTSPKVLSTSDKMDALSEILGERLASSLLSFLPSELSISLLKESCKTLTRSRDEHVRDSVRNALNDIGKVVEVLTAESSFGVDIVLDTSLVYRPATFSDGIIFILSVEVQQKTRKRSVVVLAGGRYDSSLSRERHPNDLLPSSPLCLVGCSISMEILAHIRKCVSGDSSSIPCSAVVCSYSMDLLLEKFRLARQLWNRGIATDILHEPVDSLDSLVEHCDSRGIENILVVFGTNEVLLRSNDVDHGKLDFDTAVAVMSISLDLDDEENVTIVTTPLSATRSGATYQNNLQHTATVSNCNITFALPDKVPFSAKKRIENQVGAVLTDVVTLFSSKIRIEVVVTELSIDLLKTIAGSMNRNIEQDQLTLLFDGLSRHHGKAKECLESLFQCLSHICSPRQMVVPVIVLYRHQDGFYRIVA